MGSTHEATGQSAPRELLSSKEDGRTGWGGRVKGGQADGAAEVGRGSRAAPEVGRGW